MRPTTLLVFGTTAAAWSSFFSPAEELINKGRQLLEIRQATTRTSSDLSLSLTQGQTGGSTTTNSATTTQTGSNTAKTTGSTTGSAQSSKSDSSKATTTSNTQTVFDPAGGPGGISMVTPNPMSGVTYYKINDPITFGWNYTSVSILPSAIDILAVGASNSVTYTLAQNQSVSGSSGAFTWDTGAFQSSMKASSTPLAMESYTLIVHDAAKDVSATPTAGYLGTANQFRFTMYEPSPYTEWKDWKCVTCSAAPSAMDKRTTAFVMGTAAVTVISFTWFAGVAGLW